MPVVITLRNVPYAALVTVLVLAFGDTLGSKVAIVVLAGFFPRPGQHLPRAPGRGLRGSGRMRVLDASAWETFLHVRRLYAIP